MPPGLSEIASPGSLANFDLDSIRNDLVNAGADRITAKHILVEYHKYFGRDLHRETVVQFLAQFPEPEPEKPEKEEAEE